ncbi:MAG TPA: response regulator, partial [Burkholderiaceae bacterium]|nr:response regulator [Burkholderiaceae bacterium]
MSLDWEAEDEADTRLRRVYVVDDEEPVRDALVFLLNSCGIEALGFERASEFLEALDQEGSAQGVRGCFLVDVRLGVDNGLALHATLVRRGFMNPVIFLTGHGDVPMAVEALKRGAFDFIEKPYSDEVLIERVGAALA